jgi:hypothetical protein
LFVPSQQQWLIFRMTLASPSPGQVPVQSQDDDRWTSADSGLAGPALAAGRERRSHPGRTAGAASTTNTEAGLPDNWQPVIEQRHQYGVIGSLHLLKQLAAR